MKSEIISLELAVGAAAFVLGARLFSLIQATKGVPDAHRQILEAMAGGNFSALKTRTRGLGYKNPYGEVAEELIRAHQRDGDGKKRTDHIKRAGFLAEKRLIRRTRQGQALDLAALAFACGIVVFSRKTLPAGPVFWSLGGAVVVMLLSSLVARAQLKASVLSSLAALRMTLEARPQLPSLSEENLPCFWCGGDTARASFEMRSVGSDTFSVVEATSCLECGKLVTTLEPQAPPSSDPDV